MAILFDRLSLFCLQSVVDFFPVNGDLFRRVYAESHLIAFDSHHSHGDLVSDHY